MQLQHPLLGILDDQGNLELEREQTGAADAILSILKLGASSSLPYAVPFHRQDRDGTGAAPLPVRGVIINTSF